MIDKLNALVGKPYDKEDYHCWHFIEEVLDVPTLKDVHVDTALNDVAKYEGKFEELLQPENYCIVLIGSSHIGIYYNGGVFHADIPMVRYESMRVIKMKYKDVRYYSTSKKTI